MTSAGPHRLRASKADDRPAVLVLGQGNRQSLTILRSLHASGFRTILGRGGRPGYVEVSRSADEIWPHPPLGGGTQAFADALSRLIGGRRDLAAVFPSGDFEVEVLAGLGGLLPENVVAVMPDPASALACLDKVAATNIADRLGLPVAPYRAVAGMAGLHDAIGDIGFPCVVKPTRARHLVHGRKAVICVGEDGFRAAFPAWPAGHRTLIVQEMVPGCLRAIQFASQAGRVLCAIQVDTLRSDRLDGIGFSCLMVTAPLSGHLLASMEQLLAHFRYTGVGEIQFQGGDGDGRHTFLELNPRPSGIAAISRAVGHDYPALAMGLATGQAAPAAPGFDYPVGVLGSSIHLDLLGMRRAYRGREIGFPEAVKWSGNALFSLLRARTDMTCSWRDPLPGLYGFLAPNRGARRTLQN